MTRARACAGAAAHVSCAPRCMRAAVRSWRAPQRARRAPVSNDCCRRRAPQRPAARDGRRVLRLHGRVPPRLACAERVAPRVAIRRERGAQLATQLVVALVFDYKLSARAARRRCGAPGATPASAWLARQPRLWRARAAWAAARLWRAQRTLAHAAASSLPRADRRARRRSTRVRFVRPPRAHLRNENRVLLKPGCAEPQQRGS